MLFLLLALLMKILFSNGLVVHQQQHNMMDLNGFAANDKQSPPLPVVQLVRSPANSLVASHRLLFERLSSEAKDQFAHKQMAMREAKEWDERRIPRPQRRWLMRTTELKEGSGGDKYVKRVVSESELNALLKNAWLGKKRR
ncbi:hypothetical protein niasHT_003126 [Heterodera trifolii]|uniref:Uncharacterized protein n=1 Tax=Heterodera trifolii TaxID=157864 RepID=A0ABD2M781_9BILA